VVRILEGPAYAAELAARARQEMETNWDMAVITARLADRYKALIAAKRAASGVSTAGNPGPSSPAPALQSHLQ